MSTTPETESAVPEGAAAERPPLRASDADRSATVHVLQDAVARGLLTFDEASERMAAAYSARFAHELPPLTVDLPPRAPAASPAGWQRVWTTLLEQLRAEIALVAAGGLRSPRSRRTVAVAFALIVLLITVASLAVHGLVAGDAHPFHGDFRPPGGFGDR